MYNAKSFYLRSILLAVSILLAAVIYVGPHSASASGMTIDNVKTSSGTVSLPPYEITVPAFNAGNGTANLLLVGISANDNNVTSVTFGGTALVRGAYSFYNNDAEYWYLANPNGTSDVVVKMTGPTSAVVGAYAISGVNGTGPIAAHATIHNTGASSPHVTLTAKYAGDLVFDLPSIWGGVTLGSPTCTKEWDVNIPGAITGASSYVSVPAAGQVSCKWAANKADFWDDAAVEVRSFAPSNSTVPSAPQNLAAAAGGSQVSLSWVAPLSNGGALITGYDVYRGTSSGNESQAPIASGVSSTSYVDNSVANDTTYFYYVKAVNSVGQSPASNEASATPISQGGTNGGIYLDSVKASSGTVSSSPYQIDVSGFSSATTPDLLLVGVSANNNYVASVTYGGVALSQKVFTFHNNDAEFWYLANPASSGDVVVTMSGPTSAVVGVYAFSGVDLSNPMPTTFTTSKSSGSPSVSLTTKYAGDMVVDLPSIYGGSSLSGPSCFQQWDVDMPSAVTGASSTLVVPSPATVSCTWTSSISTNSWDDAALELKSGSGQVVTTTPSAPQNLGATPGNGQVSLTWSPSASNGGSTITGYDVYRGASSGTESQTPLATGVTSTSYVDTTAANGNAYFYYVKAVNSAGQSPASNEASATPGQTTTSNTVIWYYAHRIPASYWDPCFATTCSAGVGEGTTMYVELWDAAGNVLQSGYADENGWAFKGLSPTTTYYVYPYDCNLCHGSSHNVVFQYWGDNHSAARPRATLPGAKLDGWYSCTNGCG